jgi:TRAP-type C4-dicarboxylate transport system permease small subunit
MQRLIGGYCRLIEWVIGGLLAIMVVLVFGNVVLRYAFNSGITVSEELSRWLFVWLIFLGAIVAMRDHSHLGVDSLVSRLPAWGKKLCLVASQLLMLFALWLLLQGSWKQTVINAGTAAPATGASMAIFYATGIVFAVSAGLILFMDLWKVVTGQVSEDELVQVRESEETEEYEALMKNMPPADDTSATAVKGAGK